MYRDRLSAAKIRYLLCLFTINKGHLSIMIKKEKRQTLKELRVQSRLTQPEVEEITAKKDRRIPQSTLSDWESGKKKPDVENILTLSALYKVSVEKIVDAYLYTKECNKK